jgi:hypothetical protein
MTTNTKQFDKASKPKTVLRHKHAAERPRRTSDGLFDPKHAVGNLAIQRLARQATERPIHATNSSETSTVLPVIHDVLRSQGQPLDSDTRVFMEPRFGHDFSRVRVYTDERAAESAQAVNALAYTVGQDVVFGTGQYKPETSAGRYLLAHELTHTIQQSMADQSSSLQLSPSQSEDQLEQQAKSIARAVATPSLSRQQAVPIVSATASLHVARKEEDRNPTEDIRLRHTRPMVVRGAELKEAVLKDEDYIDNNLESMRFFGSAATLHYQDGTSLNIGLVPQEIKRPIETVDYHSARSEYTEVLVNAKEYKFIPKSQVQEPKKSYPEIVQRFAQTLIFTFDDTSRKIIPNHINILTAPKLCAFLRDAEDQFLKNSDAISKGAIKVYEKQRVSIILSLALGAVETLGPSVSEAMLRTVPQVTNRLIIATARIAGNSAKMMQAVRLLAVMKFLTASQKVQVILEFFKSIGYSIKNAQVIEEAEYYLMYSEDSRFAFRVMKATGDIIFGVINTKTFDYTWTSLTE